MNAHRGGEIVINSNEDFFTAQTADLKTALFMSAQSVCADVPLGFKCYCTYTNIDHVVPLRNSIISIF